MNRIDLIQSGGFAPDINLVVSNVVVPQPLAGQLLIDVQASAVNPVDWKMAEYGFLMPTPTRESPVALGCDVAGIVEATGDGLESWMGKRVVTYLGATKQAEAPTARSAYTEKVVVDADVVFEIPSESSLTFAQAASFPVGGLTAQLLLDKVSTSVGGKDEWVLIWGASSSVGFHAVQLAANKEYKVIAVASSKHKDALMKLGATAFVDYRVDNVLAVVPEILGDSKKLNAIIDCIAGTPVHETCRSLLSQYGDRTIEKVIATVMPSGDLSPEPGIVFAPVDLGSALDVPESRTFVKQNFPALLKLEPQTIRSVQGDVTAKTLQTAFQMNKDGVSGEKVVIEWNKKTTPK